MYATLFNNNNVIFLCKCAAKRHKEIGKALVTDSEAKAEFIRVVSECDMHDSTFFRFGDEFTWLCCYAVLCYSFAVY